MLLVSRIVEAEGHELIKAEDGPAALKIVAETIPDIILLDINLPGIDGLELARKFKADERLAPVPLIATTAQVLVGDRERGPGRCKTGIGDGSLFEQRHSLGVQPPQRRLVVRRDAYCAAGPEPGLVGVPFRFTLLRKLPGRACGGRGRAGRLALDRSAARLLTIDHQRVRPRFRNFGPCRPSYQRTLQDRGVSKYAALAQTETRMTDNRVVQTNQDSAVPLARRRRWWLPWVILLLAGFGLLVVGSRWLVDGAVTLARQFGVSELIIGLTIVAFGTSAPEMMVAGFAAYDGSPSLAIGSVTSTRMLCSRHKKDAPKPTRCRARRSGRHCSSSLFLRALPRKDRRSRPGFRKKPSLPVGRLGVLARVSVRRMRGWDRHGCQSPGTFDLPCRPACGAHGVLLGLFADNLERLDQRHVGADHRRQLAGNFGQLDAFQSRGALAAGLMPQNTIRPARGIWAGFAP